MAFWQSSYMSPQLWHDIWYTTFTTVRTALLMPCIMIVVFMALRLAGHRNFIESTLFNKISVVAVGSLVAGAALRPNTPFVSVVIATAIIFGCTVAVNAMYSRGWLPGAFVKPQPMLLWVNGQFIHKHMRHCQVTEEKVHSELRLKGYVNLSKVFAITLEPPGNKFGVLLRSAVSESDDWQLLEELQGYAEHVKQHRAVVGQDKAPNGCLEC